MRPNVGVSRKVCNVLSWYTAGLSVFAITILVTRLNGPGDLIKKFRAVTNTKLTHCPTCLAFWLSMACGLSYYLRLASIMTSDWRWLAAAGDGLTFALTTAGLAWTLLAMTGSLTLDT
jgi:hypothetical protein